MVTATAGYVFSAGPQRQVVRAALLAHIFNVDHLISRHFLTEFVERHNYND